MVRFRPHPAQLALALAVVANSVLPLSVCAAAAQSAGQTSRPSLAVAVAPSSLDAAMRLLLAEPSTPLRTVSTDALNALEAHYAQTDYAPLWIGMDGLTQRGADLATALAKARDAGASTLQPIMAAVEERISRLTARLRDAQFFWDADRKTRTGFSVQLTSLNVSAASRSCWKRFPPPSQRG